MKEIRTLKPTEIDCRIGQVAKAGQRVSASIEIWEDDYDSERLVDFEGKRYEAGRITPTGRGTLLIYLSEVWR